MEKDNFRSNVNTGKKIFSGIYIERIVQSTFLQKTKKIADTNSHSVSHQEIGYCVLYSGYWTLKPVTEATLIKRELQLKIVEKTGFAHFG